MLSGTYVDEGRGVDADGERPDVREAALELDSVRHRGERKNTRAPATLNRSTRRVNHQSSDHRPNVAYIPPQQHQIHTQSIERR